MARKQRNQSQVENPFKVEGNYPDALRRKRMKMLADLGRRVMYDDTRTDELKAKDEQAADYERRKKIINTPFKRIKF